MRVIFESPPVAGTFTDPRTGQTLTGVASLRVLQYEPDEEVPARPTQKPGVAHRLSELRAQAGPGRPLTATQHARSPLRGILPATITIPESVLAGLPADANLQMFWRFTPMESSS